MERHIKELWWILSFITGNQDCWPDCGFSESCSLFLPNRIAYRAKRFEISNVFPELRYCVYCKLSNRRVRTQQCDKLFHFHFTYIIGIWPLFINSIGAPGIKNTTMKKFIIYLFKKILSRFVETEKTINLLFPLFTGWFSCVTWPVTETTIWCIGTTL